MKHSQVVPLLDVLIVTHGPDGLEKVRRQALPHVEGVRYVVAWQNEGKPVGEGSGRDDVIVVANASSGSSANRNAAIEASTAPLILMADNDLIFDPEGLKSIIDAYSEHPDADIILFRYDYPGQVFFPDAATDISHRTPKGMNVATFQISCRKSALCRSGVRFDLRFGIGGSRYECAEDAVFFHDCQRAGLRCLYIPVTIVSHPSPFTCSRLISDPRHAAGEGAYIRHRHGWAGLLRVPLFVWRNRHRMAIWWGLRHVGRGFLSYRRLPLEKPDNS